MYEITIRREGGDFLTIRLWGRSRPEAEGYWDRNWITAGVDVQVPGFTASVGGQLWAEELASFHKELTRVQDSLRGTAELVAMEDWLRIRVEGDGRGHMTCWCFVKNERGGDTLSCCLATDQTFTRFTLAELAAAVEAFPVKGKPR
jgi:hypothetical protein